MVSGSVPSSLSDRTDQAPFAPQGEGIAKLELERQIADLTKKKSKLLEETQKLVKANDAMVASEKSYREQIAAWKAEQVKEIEQLKANAIKEQRAKSAKLDVRDQELNDEHEQLLVIYEYLTELADELVWWSAHSDTREEEIRQAEVVIRKKGWEMDDNASEAESLVKKARAMLEAARTESYQKISAVNARLETATELKDKNEKLNNELLEKKKVLLAKHETLVELEASLENQKVVLLDREATLARGFRDLQRKQL